MGRKDLIPMDRWPLMLPMYMAEHEASASTPLYTLEEIAKHFDITVEDIELFSKQVVFRAEVRAAISELKDTTSVLRQKAKAQLEMYLDTFVPQSMVSEEFPSAEKVKLLKFLQEVSETGGSTAVKAKAKLEALPEQKATSLNIFITSGGETKPVSGVTITQEEEKDVIVIEQSEEKDG